MAQACGNGGLVATRIHALSRHYYIPVGHKKAANAARAGTLALAAFVSRPQAEAQIGANQIEIYNVIRSLSMQYAYWAEPGEAQRLYQFVGFRCRLTQPT